MNNDFLQELLALHPDLENEYKSEQYKLSLEIISLMMKLGANSQKMSKIIGCNHKKYLRLESGDNSISIVDYQNAIAKLKIFHESLDERKEFSFKISTMINASVHEKSNKMVTIKNYTNSTRSNSTKSSKLKLKSYFILCTTDYLYTKDNIFWGHTSSKKGNEDLLKSYQDHGLTYQY